ncbi:hypothetical protein PC114_g26567 [Phytophthora cactorum]|uniref:Uncharacterized protein n=1 Tax=Phytophthora cactorum TaxID=29920 RepID=A0A8T1AFI2_9STRA|nr:hypothetical protein PC114_g26567 [Phytophthora cactorum]KAG2881173.1 hypothetical protein PC117_g26437 [Phytophthora cactorum]KAG2973295.1 hypothetical protein PC120_g26165 [Phytophthora cactorum]
MGEWEASNLATTCSFSMPRLRSLKILRNKLYHSSFPASARANESSKNDHGLQDTLNTTRRFSASRRSRS